MRVDGGRRSWSAIVNSVVVQCTLYPAWKGVGDPIEHVRSIGRGLGRSFNVLVGSQPVRGAAEHRVIDSTQSSRGQREQATSYHVLARDIGVYC